MLCKPIGIVLEAPPAMPLGQAQREAVQLAAKEWVDVRLEYGDKIFEIHVADFIKITNLAPKGLSEEIPIAQVDAVLDALGVKGREAIEAKLKLAIAGVVPLVKGNPHRGNGGRQPKQL